MIDELAAARFDKAKTSEDAKPAEALHSCLSELEEKRIRSVYVIAVHEDGRQGHYSAGPDVATFREVWTRLQWETLVVVDRMTGG